MPSKKHKPEEIIGKLREVEIVLAQGHIQGECLALALMRWSDTVRWLLR
jgi:hypothetical protein